MLLISYCTHLSITDPRRVCAARKRKREETVSFEGSEKQSQNKTQMKQIDSAITQLKLKINILSPCKYFDMAAEDIKKKMNALNIFLVVCGGG